jgi:hypothetical protein
MTHKQFALAEASNQGVTKPVPYTVKTCSGTVTLGVYVSTWKTVKRSPLGTEYRSGLNTWWPTSREEVLSQYRNGLHDRINRHVKAYGVGRKWCPDWQRTTQQFAQSINTPRLVIHWVPPWLRDRIKPRPTEDKEL